MKRVFLSIALLFGLSTPAHATGGIFGLGLVQRQVIVQRVRVAPVFAVRVQRVVAVQRVVTPVIVHSAAIVAPVQAFSLVQPVIGVQSFVSPSQFRAPERIIEKLDGTGRVIERIIER